MVPRDKDGDFLLPLYKRRRKRRTMGWVEDVHNDDSSAGRLEEEGGCSRGSGREQKGASAGAEHPHLLLTLFTSVVSLKLP